MRLAECQGERPVVGDGICVCAQGHVHWQFETMEIVLSADRASEMADQLGQLAEAAAESRPSSQRPRE